MKNQTTKLLEEFVSWAKNIEQSCRPDVVVSIELSPPYDKQSVLLTFEDEVSGASITVWDSGEMERQYSHIENDEVMLWAYLEKTDPSKFNDFAQPIVAKFIALK